MKSLNKKDKIIEAIFVLITTILIIFISVITIKYLKPIVFGLILSFLSLPIYNFFRKYVFYNDNKKNKTIHNNKNIKIHKLKKINIFLLTLYKILKIFSIRLSTKMLRKIAYISKNNIEKIDENNKNYAISNINKSYYITILTFIFVILFIIYGTTIIIIENSKSLDISYENYVTENNMNNNNKTDNNNIELNLSENNKIIASINAKNIINKIEKGFDKLYHKIESINPKIVKNNFIISNTILINNKIKELINSIFNNPENIINILIYIITNDTKVLLTTTDIATMLFTFFIYLIFTFFFFLFFLKKIIMFDYKLDGQKLTTSSYIVDTITDSSWMPNVSTTIKTKTNVIINGIFLKLKSWMKGYLLLIIIESIIYSTLFGILKIPFFITLGIMTGISIILPYIGTLFSISIVSLVYLSVNNATLLQLSILIISYMIIAGIIDQLILYPIIIGGSLDLNPFETVAFVLLGGIFGGIIGMVLSVPILSIVKYVIPEIYNTFNLQKN